MAKSDLQPKEFWSLVGETYILLKRFGSAQSLYQHQQVWNRLLPNLERISTQAGWDDKLKSAPTEELIDEVLWLGQQTRLAQHTAGLAGPGILRKIYPGLMEDAWQHGVSPSEIARALHGVASMARLHCIGELLNRRRLENENKYGKAVRRFLVYRRDASGKGEEVEHLENLLRIVQGRTPRTAFDPEEKRSIAIGLIFDALETQWRIPVVGLDKRALQMIVDGEFNKVPGRIRGYLRYEGAKEQRRKERQPPPIAEESVPPDYILDQLSCNAPTTRQTLIDRQFGQAEDSMLIERLKDSLTERQRAFLEVRLTVDTDKEAAEQMGITPQAAYDLKSRIQEKARSLRGS